MQNMLCLIPGVDDCLLAVLEDNQFNAIPSGLIKKGIRNILDQQRKQILGSFMRYIVKDILPNENAAKVEHTEKASYDTLTDAELLEALYQRRQERIVYSEEIENADQKRLTHTGEYIEEIKKLEKENGTD